MNRAKIIAIYVRVSTEEQALEGYSIDAQTETLSKYCKDNGKIIHKVYVDGGISGKSTDGRFALQQMLDDAKKGEFDEVIVWKISRLSRKTLDLLRIVEELNRNNITFYSYSEKFEINTAMGRFMLQMMGAVAELERNTIVDNVKLGMKQRAKTGKWNGGIVFGYDIVTVNTGSKHRESTLEINPEEAQTVRKIFDLYSQGKGLKSITNQLNHEGYKSKKGNAFSVNAIKEILNNPVYIGKIRYNVRENWSEKRRKGTNPNPIIVDGQHDKIIPLELWEKVQEMYKLKSGRPPRTFDGCYPLTGLLRCPVCGSGMVAHRIRNTLKDGTIKVLRYYTCGNFKNKGTAVCKANSIRADYAEEYVFSKLSKVICNDKVLKDIVTSLNKKRKNTIKPLQEELRYVGKRIEEFSTKREKYFKLYEDDVLDKYMLVTRLNELQSEVDRYARRKIEIELELQGNDSQEIHFDLVKSVLTDFQSLLTATSPEQKKSLLQLIITQITIKDRKSIDTIELHFDDKIIKYFLNSDNDTPPDNSGGGFSVSAHKKMSLLMVRFSLVNPK
jgi:site-specific DNA recombinase